MSNTQQVTEKVKKLYNEVPYFSYGVDYFPVFKALGLSREEFFKKFEQSQALEVGCGGGQLTAFMASAFHSVKAVDISEVSLKRAEEEISKRGLANVSLALENLFDDDFISRHQERFDFVLCYGVLHHTASPAEGFSRLTRLLKPGGTLLVGVYSRTQIAYRLRRKLVILLAGNDSGKRVKWAKKFFYRNKPNDVSIYDGYVHPQVSFHSVGEVMKWLRKSGMNYTGSWPPVELPVYLALMKNKTAPLKNFSWSRNILLYWLVELVWILLRKQVMVSVACRKGQN